MLEVVQRSVCVCACKKCEKIVSRYEINEVWKRSMEVTPRIIQFMMMVGEAAPLPHNLVFSLHVLRIFPAQM